MCCIIIFLSLNKQTPWENPVKAKVLNERGGVQRHCSSPLLYDTARLPKISTRKLWQLSGSNVIISSPANASSIAITARKVLPISARYLFIASQLECQYTISVEFGSSFHLYTLFPISTSKNFIPQILNNYNVILEYDANLHNG